MEDTYEPTKSLTGLVNIERVTDNRAQATFLLAAQLIVGPLVT